MNPPISPRIFLSVFIALWALILPALAAPSVTGLAPVAAATVSTLTQISVTFSEAVSGVTADDLLVNAEAAAGVSGAGAGPYIFTFTQPVAGTVAVAFDGDHGIVSTGGGGALTVPVPWSYTLVDSIAPTLAQQTPASGATVGTLVQAEVIFSEVVTGVDAADLLINGVTATGVTGSGFGPYVFTFPPPAVGAVSFTWAVGHGITDTAAVPNAFAGAGWSATRSAAGIGNLVINEFLAANGTGILDEDGGQEDWIEIHNAGATPVALAGWALTNDHDELAQWVFPAWTLNAGQYLVLYASGKNRKPAQTTPGVNNTNTLASPRLHTNFTLNENGGYLALVGPESPRVAVSQYPPNYDENAGVTEFPSQRTDYSYGPQPGGALRYFTPSTPGSVNAASSLTAITAKVNPSVGRGFFKDAFQLVLSCPDAGTTIRYTTDFSEPTAGTGTLYTGPITINATTCLRAVAFGTGKIPSLPVTHSYLFLDQVLTQSATPVGFPTNWGAHASFAGGVVPADYAMDTDPVRVDPNNGASAIDPAKQQMLKDGLRGLPLVSVTIPMIDMFGSSGLYYNPNVTNKAFGYKKCAVEMILPDGSTAFSTICGISGHGNASRDPLKNPKHGFQLKFKGDYGEGSLNYPLYPDSPVQDFDDIILRPDFNSSWRHWSDDATNVSGLYQRTRGVRIRDAFVKDTFRTMDGLASHHRFFHLFINGLYWGTYDFAEQPVDGFGKSYMGGSKADYDVIHEGNVRAGDATIYSAMTGQPPTTTNALYDTMKSYLDVPEFIDYMLLHFYIGHQDWGNIKNWYAIRRRASATNPTQGKYQYIPWDSECTLLEPTVDRVSSTDVPSGLHTKLLNNAQYKLDFADRVHRQMLAPGAPLSASPMIARFQKWQAVMDKPMIAESARWGDYRRDVHQYSTGAYVLYTRENQFLAECARLTGTYFPGRPGTLLTQLQTAGLYPGVLAPEYRQNTIAGAVVGTSQVSAGFVVAMKPPGGAGTIYFTTDGNDPHIYYTPTTGATLSSVAATAQAYAAPLTITGTTTIKARILNGGVWSALNEATFSIGVAAEPLRITEIMYNPPGGTAYEFLELQNIGTQSVDLGGWSWTGVDFVVPLGTVLAPGDRMLLANNDGQAGGAFATRYPGVSVAGWFGGSLDNGGERLALLDANGRTVVSVEYDDEAGWPTSPDGGGYSLEIIDANGDPDSPVNWKPSNALKGTPGLVNSAPPATSVVLNEVLAENAGAVLVGGAPVGYIELKNTGGVAVDVNGWTVTSSTGTYTFSGSTLIAAGGFLVLPCSPSAGGAHLAAALPVGGGYVQLKAAGGAQVDAIQYGHQLPDFAIGRVASAWTLTSPTVSAENGAAVLAPAAGNLKLNEWLSNAVPGGADWIELYNQHATLPVALQGLYFRTDTQLYRYPALSFLAPLGFLQLLADEQPGAGGLDFTLPATGTALAVLDGAGVVIDALSSVQFGAPPQGVSRGRIPNGTATLQTFTGSLSPGATNYLNSWTGPVLNEILARNVASAQAPWGAFPGWVELTNSSGSTFDLSGMKLGTSSDGAGAWIFPAGTTIPANGQLALWCDAGQIASTTSAPPLNTGLTLGAASGGLYLFNVSGQLVNQIEWGFQISDKSIGLDAGTWKLLASPTRGAANVGAHALGAVTQLRINEWMAAPISGGDWFELYNLNANPVALAGLYLTDEPSELGRTKFAIPALSFIAGQGWVKWEADDAPEAGRNHVNFTLDGGAEYLRLSNNDAGLTGLDAVSFGGQTANVSQGRILDGGATITAMAGSPTPGARNVLLPAPGITTPPASQTVMTGANVSFSIVASGSAPLSYQWSFNNVAIPGATTATLALNGVTAAQDGAYSCTATNTAGNATSTSAALIVRYGFAQWPGLVGLSGADAFANADPDRDGLTNAQEFFHNLNPQSPANAADRAALPQIAIEPPTGTPQYLTVTYRGSTRAVLTSVEHQLASTLGSWATFTPDVTEPLMPDPLTGDPRFRVKFTIAPGEARKFFRLLLTP